MFIAFGKWSNQPDDITEQNLVYYFFHFAGDCMKINSWSKTYADENV